MLKCGKYLLVCAPNWIVNTVLKKIVRLHVWTYKPILFFQTWLRFNSRNILHISCVFYFCLSLRRRAQFCACLLISVCLVSSWDPCCAHPHSLITPPQKIHSPPRMVHGTIMPSQ